VTNQNLFIIVISLHMRYELGNSGKRASETGMMMMMMMMMMI
jgi:hypothetical protein